MTSKKNLFVSTLALFLALTVFGTANADDNKKPRFTVTVPEGTMRALDAAEVEKLNVPNISDLAPEQRDAAVLNSCSAKSRLDKAPTFCIAWSGPYCTGTGVLIPCGFYTNGFFQSIQFGCTRSYLATGPDLTGTVYEFSNFPQDSCLTAQPITTFQSAACI
jgi:hypothetical protein